MVNGEPGEWLHFYALGFVVCKKKQRDYTENDFAILLNHTANSTEQRWRAMHFWLVHNNQVRQHTLCSSSNESANTSWQCPSSAKALLLALSCKSVAPLFGAEAGQVMFAFAALACGMSASTPVPDLLSTLPSVADSKLAESNELLLHGAIINRAHDNIILPPAFDALPFSSGLNGEYIIQPGDHEAPSDSELFCLQVLRPHMHKLKLHVVHNQQQRTPPEPQQTTDVPDTQAHPMSVLQIIAKIFPDLHKYLLSSHCGSNCIIPTHIRPTMANLATMVSVIWLRDDHFLYGKLNKVSGTVVLSRSQCSFDNPRAFSRTSLLEQWDTADQSHKAEIRDTLVMLNEASQYVRTNEEQERRAGTCCANNLMQRRVRRAAYTSDHLHGNNAGKQQQDMIYMPSSVNALVCEKSFPSSEVFTPGLMLMTTTNSDVDVMSCQIMDKYESALNPFLTLLNRYTREDRPDQVVYDNSCKAQAYCITREHSFFWSCRFVIDRFHEKNHNHTCSSTLRCSSYTTGPLISANTEAVEQTNKALRLKVEARLRYMNMQHAVIFLMVFFSLYNAGF